ncbi:MAG: endopeptidase La [Gammaproteobacteria bacterium]|nr:endopeptidase La [Gammaproteobacteria bacterium]
MSEENLSAAPGVVVDQNGAAESGSMPARLGDALPGKLLLLPLAGRPFFPAQTMPIVIPEDPWRETIERVGNTPHHLVGLVYASAGDGEIPSAEQISRIGTVVRMHQPMRGDGRIQFIAEGLQRFEIKSWISRERPYVAQVEYPVAPVEDKQNVRAYAQAIIAKIKELLPLNPLYKEGLRAYLERFNPDEASPLADFSAAITSGNAKDLQEVLETLPLLARMEKVLNLVQREIEVAGLQTEIRQKVEERVNEKQREFFLREQLKEIQQQLGISKDEKAIELDRFRQSLEGCTVPPDAQTRIDDELRKLSLLDTGSPEYGVTRNYLDHLTHLPWGKYSTDHIDIAHARQVLDADHEGLADVKERIVEFLGVGALKGEISGSILLLVGPPGVGKTSIGRSIASALGREFYRFSVGGMRDEAEIKGHRRTYIGAMPGKFIQALRETKTANPVILLDEIDKIGSSYQGDPASALLEVLDPEQNNSFLDHYLDVRFDLSRVLFVCTANQLDTIPRPLLDRMEVIRLSGYLGEEKLAIAKRHLWPKQRERAGLKPSQLGISNAALRKVIDEYAREAGVRNLEKQLGRIARKSVLRVLEGKTGKVQVTGDNLKEFLGNPVFRQEAPQRGVGVVTGLAWTAMGGATLDVEASLVHTLNRGFKLTGQLGEVMKESAEIAYSYVAAHLREHAGDPKYFDESFVHLHVPEGATPKDGPSAGITMATALLSLARAEAPGIVCAMTGELTLTGRVLPVGGIREKLIAAKRSGLKRALLPAANRGDYDELPAYIKAGIQFDFVSHFSEVVNLVFPPPRRRAAPAGAARKPARRGRQQASRAR